MYGWMNQHLNLGLDSPVLERDFELAGREDLTVWDADHPQPPGGEDFERGLLQLWASIVEGQLLGLLQGDQQQAAELSRILQDGWRVCLGLTTHAVEQLEVHDSTSESGAFVLAAEHFEPWSLRPRPARSNADNSKFGSADPRRLDHGGSEHSGLDHSHPLLDMWKPTHHDLHIEIRQSKSVSHFFYPELEGETTTSKTDAEGEYVFLRTVRQRLVKNPRLAAAYTYGYNLPLFATRAQQLGLAIKWLSTEFPGGTIIVRGRRSEAALAAAGVFCAQASGIGQEVRKQLRLEIEPGDFSFAAIGNISDPNFLPGSARFMDVPGLLAALVDTRIKVSGDHQATLMRLARMHRLHNNELVTGE